MEYAFLVLHYIAYEETVSCVDTLLNNFKEKDNFSIIIVDNGSNNGSYEQLVDEYNDEKKVTLIKNSENLGFARGNNVGLNYIKNNLNVDFVIMINNDLYITQPDFFEVIENIFNRTNFTLLGPDETNNIPGVHNNPQKVTIVSRKDVVKQLRSISFDEKLCKLHLNKVVAAKNKLLNRLNNKQLDYTMEQFDIKLSGGCFIFSSLFLKDYGMLFSKTFIYGEEDILHWMLTRDNKTIVYSPKLHVFHNEKVSTKTIMNSNYKRALFYYKNKKESLKAFLEFIDSGKVIY